MLTLKSFCSMCLATNLMVEIEGFKLVFVKKYRVKSYLNDLCVSLESDKSVINKFHQSRSQNDH